MSLRWAARFAFSEDLWRSQSRVVVDPALEDALLSGLPMGDDAEALRELVDDLVPATPPRAWSVWMGVSSEDVARRLGKLRPGTTFVPLDRLPQVLRDVSWSAGLFDLDACVAGAEPTDDIAGAALRWLGLAPEPARSIIVWGATESLDYDALADAMTESLRTPECVQRIYGLYQPPMAAVVDFGESVDAGGDGDLEITLTVRPSELRAEDEDVPLYFDNSLGAQEPELDELMGVCAEGSLPEGLGLVELPRAGRSQPSGLRAQVLSAQERAQRVEVERQALLDRLDQLQRENRELRDAVESGPNPVDALARDEALEASMAREQSLKWKVSGLEHQLSQAIARPVEALEAELARLQATPAESPTPISGDFRAPAEEGEPELVVLLEDRTRDQALAAQLLALVRRLERGGIGVLALRRQLGAIARRLRTPSGPPS